jgi:hypothetical protein
MTIRRPPPNIVKDPSQEDPVDRFEPNLRIPGPTALPPSVRPMTAADGCWPRPIRSPRWAASRAIRTIIGHNHQNMSSPRSRYTLVIPTFNRREFLRFGGTGLSSVALLALLHEQKLLAAKKDPIRPEWSSQNPYAPRQPHYTPRAKNVLVIFCSGALSHIDAWDYKPELIKRSGEKTPEELVKNIRLAQIGKDAKLLGTNYKFAQRGKSGVWLSELLPQLATIVDDVAFVQGFYSEAFNHDPATIFMNTGAQLAGQFVHVERAALTVAEDHEQPLRHVWLEVVVRADRAELAEIGRQLLRAARRRALDSDRVLERRREDLRIERWKEIRERTIGQ